MTDTTMHLSTFFRCAAFALALPLSANAQRDSLIYLTNPSFEDAPGAGKTPVDWSDCSTSGNTPPDVQPGAFGVSQPPSHGNTYLSLMVCDDSTRSAVSQRLSRSLAAGKQYEFSLNLCKSTIYNSVSKTTGQPANYVTPVKLRIWGGDSICSQREILHETSIVTNTRWITCMIRLTPPKGACSHLTFEVAHKTPMLFPYNGNLLLDNASAIRPRADAQKEQGRWRKGTYCPRPRPKPRQSGTDRP